ncbi:MAG: DUF3107 domain-containing protein [Actinomycetales bacterium]
MEVKIGVQYAPREIVIESTQSSEEVAGLVQQAFEGSAKVLSLTDDKGRQVIVPTDKLAYVEIGEPEVRRVGFGTL